VLDGRQELEQLLLRVGVQASEALARHPGLAGVTQDRLGDDGGTAVVQESAARPQAP